MGQADLMVGIPSFGNADTIGFVVRAATAGMVQYFPDLKPILVNSDGGYTSNQALPPFPAGTANPGRAGVALPGIAVYDIDHPDVPPIVLP